MGMPGGANVGRGVPTPGKGMPQVQRGPGPFAPPSGRGTPAQVSLRLPPNIRTGLSMFQPGSVLHARVTGQTKGGMFMLRLGEHNLQAQSKVPLTVGKSVQFKVQGQQNGRIQLQLLKSPFTKMSTADVSQTLTSLKVPTNEGNVNLAKVMVEHKIPLTRENFTALKTVLANPPQPGANGQLPSLNNRVSATQFLQQSQLPMTPQNVNTIANFLNTNPQIGVQMVALNTEFRTLAKAAKGNGTATVELMSGVQSALGEFILEPKKRSEKKKSSSKLKNFAKQGGIEGNLGSLYRGSDDGWDLLQMMRQLRSQMPKDGETEKLMALLKGLEENLEAHKLINQGRSENNMGWYYLQVPMRLENGEEAEIWLRYYTNEDGGGGRFVDLEDTSVEFLVTTADMGELYFTIDLKGEVANIDMGTPNEEVREFAARYLPALADRIARLGWKPGRVSASYRAHQGKRELVEREDFEDLERCSVQA